MTISQYRPLLPSWFKEFLLTILVILGFCNLVHEFYYRGFLPLPFVFDTSDTFMDWFNPAFYAHNGRAYGEYISVYAPLSFVLLEILGMPFCYRNAIHPKDVRACDVVGIGAIFFIYALCVIFAAAAFYKKDKKTAAYRTIALSLSLPLLYALERGNLVMLAFVAFFMFYGDLVKRSPAVAATAAFMINLKSYLLFNILGLGIKRDWRLLENAGYVTLGIYAITLAIYGSGTPVELYNNLQTWFSAMSGIVWDQISYSTTYKPFLQFDVGQYPIRSFIPDRTIFYITLFIKSEVFLSRTVALLCVGLSWFYPKAITKERLAFFLLMQSFISDNPGGYGQVFLIFLVFLEPWKNGLVGTSIIMAYLLSIPTDHVMTVALTVDRPSWLTGRTVETVYGLSMGALIRPLAILIMLWTLAIDTLMTIRKLARREPAMWRAAPDGLSTSPAV